MREEIVVFELRFRLRHLLSEISVMSCPPLRSTKIYQDLRNQFLEFPPPASWEQSSRRLVLSGRRLGLDLDPASSSLALLSCLDLKG